MKTSTLTFTIALGCGLLIAGCDSLDLQPRDELSSDAVWQDPALAEAFLNDVYNGTGLGYGDPMPTPGVVDEAVNTHGHDGGDVVMSTLTPDDRGIWDNPGWRPQSEAPYEQYSWEEVYSHVRNLNIFIQNVDGNDAMPAVEREVLLGEAYFLRGYFYHNLMKLYGGVPLIDTPFELGSELEQFQVPRGSFEETINFIVSDLDRAADRLSIEGRRLGAATRGAALALKSRVLLFAASDLYNVNPSGMAETGYTGGDQQQRWQAAKDAAQAVVDLGAYSLDPAPTWEEYQELIVWGGGSGLIWGRFFDQAGPELTCCSPQHNHSQFVSPNGYNSWSGDTPTQQHVDAYEMSDGSEFSWDNPEHAANPYQNRDPRFDANVLYNGKVWRPRPSGANTLDPRGVIQTGWYEMPGQAELRPGLDTREGPIQNWNGTRTGYNLAKFVDRTKNPDTEQAFNPWIHIRYAEVLLNFAEASEELGQTADALLALNQVRSRVGMPDVTGPDSRTVLDRIRNEREIELAFEGHRYFDVRRWMIGPEAYTDGLGIRITGRLDPNGELLVTNRYRYEYDIITVQQRAWDDKNYFLPIARDEMNRNPNLVQNPGYN